MGRMSMAFLKGKTNTVLGILVNYVISYIFLVLIIGKISSLNTITEVNYNLNNENVFIAQVLDVYYTLPIVRGAQKIDDNNQLSFNERLDIFYEETKEVLKPIIMDCTNYESVYGESTLAQEFNQLTVTVNEYYLDINPIHNTNNEIIQPTDFVEGALNILVPDTMEKEEVIDSQFAYYKSQGYEFNCIYYKSGEVIRAVSPYVGRNKDGLIDNPIIIIYDSELIWGQMLNYVSSGHIYFRLKSNEPYEEILPFLKRYNLDVILTVVEPVSNIYDNSITNVNKAIRMAFLEIGIMFVVFCLTTINMCKNYVMLRQRQFAVKLMYGYSVWNLNWQMFILILLQYLIILLVSIITEYNWIVILGICVVQLVLEIISFNVFLKKKVTETLKGSE